MYKEVDKIELAKALLSDIFTPFAVFSVCANDGSRSGGGTTRTLAILCFGPDGLRSIELTHNAADVPFSSKEDAMLEQQHAACEVTKRPEFATILTALTSPKSAESEATPQLALEQAIPEQLPIPEQFVPQQLLYPQQIVEQLPIPEQLFFPEQIFLPPSPQPEQCHFFFNDPRGCNKEMCPYSHQ
jgi:hypothetical protein